MASKSAHREWVAKNREYIKIYKILNQYGLTKEQYDDLSKVCVICGSRSRLCVDHSHQTGRIRGMLCDRCNKGIGFFGDNPTLLLRAADYVLGVANADIFALTYELVEEG